MELLSFAWLGWLLQPDAGCIFCNWYDVPGGPFGPLGAAAAGAAAAAAAASALNNLMEDAQAAEDMRREQRGPRGGVSGNQEGISDISTGMDTNEYPPEATPSPPGGPNEV